MCTLKFAIWIDPVIEMTSNLQQFVTTTISL